MVHLGNPGVGHALHDRLGNFFLRGAMVQGPAGVKTYLTGEILRGGGGDSDKGVRLFVEARLIPDCAPSELCH